MGFLMPKQPKVPKPVPPANSPILARDTPSPITDIPFNVGSLITTSSSGLKRKASTQRTSLIGG
jgi:hypothetical protein